MTTVLDPADHAGAAAHLREHIDIAVRTRYYCLTGEWLTDENRTDFVDLVAFVVATELGRMAHSAERMTIVHDQDSDDGWRSWIRERAAAIDATITATDEDDCRHRVGPVAGCTGSRCAG